MFQKSGPRGRGRRRRCGQTSVQIVEEHSASQARGNPVSRRHLATGEQGELCRSHDARDGQSAGGNARRRAGSHRHDVLHGGRRAAAVRANHHFRAPQQVLHDGAQPPRRLRTDHAVEFPHGHSLLEDHAGADLRQYRGSETRHGHAAFRLQPRAGSGGSRLAARGGESGDGHRRRCGQPLDAARTMCARFPLPARRKSAARFPKPARQASSTAAWKWAARTSSWCWKTPIWTSPWRARFGVASGPPASAARPPAAWWCRKAFTRISSTASWHAPAP